MVDLNQIDSHIPETFMFWINMISEVFSKESTYAICFIVFNSLGYHQWLQKC